MDFAIFRLFIRVSLFVIALIACIIYLIKKRKLIYSIFFDKEAIKKEYTGKNDIIFLRFANTILVIVAILLILYLKDFVLDMPYIINKQYSYAEGYVTEQSHGGADISSERRSIFLYDKVKDDEIEITVFSRYVDKNTYLKVQYLPHTKYGAIVENKYFILKRKITVEVTREVNTMKKFWKIILIIIIRKRYNKNSQNCGKAWSPLSFAKL